jgi:hypothetical protein
MIRGVSLVYAKKLARAFGDNYAISSFLRRVPLRMRRVLPQWGQ